MVRVNQKVWQRLRPVLARLNHAEGRVFVRCPVTIYRETNGQSYYDRSSSSTPLSHSLPRRPKELPGIVSLVIPVYLASSRFSARSDLLVTLNLLLEYFLKREFLDINFLV